MCICVLKLIAMNINYKLQGVKPIKKLSVRFYHHKFYLVRLLILCLWSLSGIPSTNQL
jgi:hypothetical protein